MPATTCTGCCNACGARWSPSTCPGASSPERWRRWPRAPRRASSSAPLDEIVNTLEQGELAHGVIALDDLHHVDDPQALDFIDRVLPRLPERWTVAITTRRQPALRCLSRLRAAGAGHRAGRRRPELHARRGARAAVVGRRRADRRRGLVPANDGLAGRPAAGAGRGARRRPGQRDRPPGLRLPQPPRCLRNWTTGCANSCCRRACCTSSTPTRCEALTGDRGPGPHLEALERLDLFVTVVGDDPRTLKLHDLFRDTLRHRLRLERPGEHDALLVRAAANERDLVRRQGLLLAAGRPDEAAASLRAGSLRLLFEGGVHVVVRLAEQFPPEFARRSADWQDVAGYAKWRLWRNVEAAQHLEAAESAAPRTRRRRRGAPVGAATGCDAGRHRPPGRGARRARRARAARPRRHRGPHLRPACAELWIALEEGAGRSVAPRMEELLDALEQASQPEHWAAMVPSPRLTACPGVGPQLLRWADAREPGRSRKPAAAERARADDARLAGAVGRAA